MKIRQGFVTNSSSSSFIILKNKLDEDQLNAIRNHRRLAEKLNLYCWDESWHIDENDEFISGYTWMDNFDMYRFLEIIEVNMKNITWGENPFDLDRLENNNSETQIIENSEWKKYLKELEDY